MIKIRTAILISGRGSNMQALVEASHKPGYPAEIVLVLANNAEAEGLAWAISRNIPAIGLVGKVFPNRKLHEDALNAALQTHDVELICLAGYMRILTPGFVDKWQSRILNIHPSLLPRFPGLNTHQRALDAGETQHGCSIHFVTGELDAGPVIMQGKVPILKGDDADTLAQRVLKVEHELYPRALEKVATEWLTRQLPCD